MARRSGVTLVESLVALAIFGLLAIVWWGVVSTMRRGEAKLGDRAAALATAEIAVARLSLDVKSMFPPDPFRPERCPEVAADGSSFAFLRCERASGGMTARRVRYATRAAGRAPGSGIPTFQLLRDGRPIAGVLLSAFSAQLIAGPRGEPRLHVKLTGLAGAESHLAELDLALPAPGPAATIGLPGAADALLERAIKLVFERDGGVR